MKASGIYGWAGIQSIYSGRGGDGRVAAMEANGIYMGGA